MIENRFFLLQKEVDGFLIQRKEPLQSSAQVELLELLSEIDQATYLLVAQNDFYLFKDLQLLGLSFVGYRGAATDSEIVSLAQIEKLSKIRPQYLVLKKDKELTYQVSHGALDTIHVLRNRESLKRQSRFHPSLSPLTTVDARTVRRDRYSELRVHNSFDQVISARRSASSFKNPVSDSVLMELMRDTFGYRDPIKRFFLSAGAISEFQVMLLQVDKNRYSEYDATIDQFLPADVPDIKALFDECLQGQRDYQGAETWLFTIVNLEKMIEKYGPRAFRFAMMSAGSMIQQMHLSAESYNLDYRFLGGFDDQICHSILGLNKHQVFLGFVALGAR